MNILNYTPNHKSKIAYIFQGYLRTFQVSNVAELIDKYPGDIFVHCYDTINVGSPLIIDHKYFEEFLSRRYKITSYMIENAEQIWQKSHWKDDKPIIKSLYQPCYSRGKAYELLRKYEEANNIKYDVIVFSRPDIHYDNIDFNEILEDKDDFVYVAVGSNNYNAGIFADQTQICNNRTAEYYIQAMNQMVLEMPSTYSPETFISAAMMEFNQKIKFLRAEVSYLRMTELKNGMVGVCLQGITNGVTVEQCYEMLKSPGFYKRLKDRKKSFCV